MTFLEYLKAAFKSWATVMVAALVVICGATGYALMADTVFMVPASIMPEKYAIEDTLFISSIAKAKFNKWDNPEVDLNVDVAKNTGKVELFCTGKDSEKCCAAMDGLIQEIQEDMQKAGEDIPVIVDDPGIAYDVSLRSNIKEYEPAIVVCGIIIAIGSGFLWSSSNKGGRFE